MKIQNILWDVDGTLFDTYPAITYALSKSLNEMGLPVALNVIDGLTRQSISHCIKTLSQRFKLDPDLFHARFAASYRMVDPANQPPFPGVREVCETIRNRGGLNIVITHRGIKSTQALLETHGLSDYFEDLFSVEQDYSRKPDPAMVLVAIEKHGLNPSETLMIGDRDLDIQAGRAAGVRTCLFRSTNPSQPADRQIQHYSELLTLIQESNES